MSKKRIVIIVGIILFFIVGIILSFIYNKNKYSVYFETGTNDVLLVKYVGEGDKITEPKEPIKDGYIFKEWQFKGEKYDFNSSVEDDLVLTAKWIKEEYITIKYIEENGELIDSVEILKGDKIDALPIVSKDGYSFIGWYLGDEEYSNQELYDDTTIVAKYEEETKKIEFKIGDSVDIVGNYASASNSNNANYDAAIGWDRIILDIVEESEFPYMVGDDSGVTGFFKESSLKLRSELNE